MLLISDFDIGMSAEIIRSFSANDVEIFSELSGDVNPVHLDSDYAQNSIFGARIVHGALASSIFSTIFANTLPGPGCIYFKSENKFLKPIYLNESVTFKVIITDVLRDKKRIIFKTVAIVRDQESILGTAEIFIP
ncbi:MaoC family dehydratase [Psychrobacter urativorans]|uniref:MaoC family dehydratase n=1 Tax=Psychrobacter urativorans TaxID=45610 RepID=UPI001917DC42|nr:MaoC family dehydratase [Psychrobacter urativorans]